MSNRLLARCRLRARSAVSASPLVRPFTIPGRVTYTRTGLTTGIAPSGSIYEVAANVPRFNAAGEAFWEGQRTNSHPDPRCETAGTGTPGTLPSGMFTALGAGINQQVVAKGTLNGVPGFYIRFFGAVGSPQQVRIIWGGTTTFAWATGANIAVSVYCALTDGSYPVGTIFSGAVAGFTGGGAATGNNITTTFTDPGATPERRELAGVSGASNAFGRPECGFTFQAGSFDATFFIGGFDIELASAFASTLALPSVGVPAAATRGADTGAVTLLAGTGAGTLVFAMRPGQAAGATAQVYCSISAGADADRIEIVNLASGNDMRMTRVVTSVGTNTATLGNQTPGSMTVGVVSWDGAGNAAAKIRGGTYRSIGSITTGMTQARIGNRVSGAAALFGAVGWLDELPGRYLTEAQMDVEIAKLARFT